MSRRISRQDTDRPPDSGDADGLSGVSELIRRLAALGLSGFFTTESALRRALGDTLPKDWVDFAAEQSERTRHELLDRVAAELGRFAETVELADVLEKLLAGRTIEISAQIRLGEKRSDEARPADDQRSDSDRPIRLEIGKIEVG